METLLNAAIWIALFGLIYFLFLSKLSFYQANRWFLLAGIVAAFILPFLHFNVIVEQNITNHTAFNNVMYDVKQESVHTFDWMQVLLIIYALGVVFFLIKMIIDLSSMYKRYKNADTYVENGFKISQTHQDISAFSFFNWIVINTHNFDENEQKILLNHEKVHAKQWHSIDIILAYIVKAFQWFNPVVYWYKNQIIHNLEYIADNQSQHIQNNKSLYAKMILRTTVMPMQYQLVNNFNSSLIKKRIHMLHQSPSNPNKKWLYFLIIPAIALVFSAFNKQEVIHINYPEDFPIAQDSIIVEGLKINLIIDKNSTDADLQREKEFFKTQDIDLDYSKVKRNATGELTAISLKVKNNSNSGSYVVKGDKPIKPIEIMVDLSNHELSIGTVTNEEIDQLIDENIQTKIFISKDVDSNEVHQWIEGDSIKTYTIIVDESYNNDDNKKIKQKIYITPKKSKIEIIEADNGQLIYKVDGKEVSKEEVDRIKSENIEEVRVFKRDYEKQKKVIVIEGEDEETAIYKVNGKVMSKEEIEKMDPEEIKEVRVFKHSKNEGKVNVDINQEKKIIVIEGDDADTAVYKVNGKEMSKEEVEKMAPEDIKEIKIIKKNK